MWTRPATSTGSRKRSSSVDSRVKKPALSLVPSSTRYPSVDMRTIDDVATLSCIEVSKSIMMRPEVNTGSFFSAIGASRNDVNKSDTVLIISAAILEEIGNVKASKDLLNKSKTVSDFYGAMGLRDPKLRTSFVIMLFALAPEFVKMVEVSLKRSLERVQDVTKAPHADAKLTQAAGELMVDGLISTNEHSNILADFANLRVDTTLAVEDSSVQNTPDDGINVSDSISNLGKGKIVKDDSPMNTLGIMRYIKNNPQHTASAFYEKFPRAKKPLAPTPYRNKTGLGYNEAESAITDAISESNFTTMINSLLGDKTKKTTARPRLSDLDKVIFKRRNSIAKVETVSPTTFITAQEAPIENFRVEDFEVTRKDIDDHKRRYTTPTEDRSKILTNIESKDNNSYLLDLL